MCTGGSEVTIRPLPSLVTRQMVPVSATAKLPPVMPTSAERNTSRSRRRAKAVRAPGSSVRPSPPWRRNSSATWPRLRCTAGAMMCEGGSPVNWTIHSPRSVSTTSRPAAASAPLSPISSVTIDLALATRRAPWRCATSIT